MDALRGLGIGALGLGVLACGGSGSPQVTEVSTPVSPGPTADPALAIDAASGDWLLTWVGADSSAATWNLWFARSPDHGTSWSDPVRVSDKANDVHPHGESSPRLVASPRGILAAVWTNSMDVAGRAWPASNIRFARSSDGGVTWSRAITLNDDTAQAPAGHIFHGAAWSGDSSLLVAWLDERTGATAGNVEQEGAHPGHHPSSDLEPDARVYLASSTNAGARWGPNHPLWGAACPCCRVSLARGPDGNVVAAWRKHFPGSVRDPVVAPVTSDPSPQPETRVSTDGWVYPGCPHTGPGVTVDGRGATHVAWFTGKLGGEGVFYARQPASNAASFGAPVAVFPGRLTSAHPRVAALPDGGAIVATDVESRQFIGMAFARITADGRLSGRREIASKLGVDHPDAVALPDSTVLVAWTEKENVGGEPRTRIRITRVVP